MDVVVDIDTHESSLLEIGIPLFVRNVAACLLVPELLTMAEIDHVDEWSFWAKTDTEITEPKIPVNIANLMNFLKSVEYLQPDEQTSDGIEPVVAEFMEFC